MAEPVPAHRRPGDRALGLVLVALVVVLLLTLVAAWLAVREPLAPPLPVPSVSRG